MESIHAQLLMSRSGDDGRDSTVGRLRAGISRIFGGQAESPEPETFDVPPAPRSARAVIYARLVYDENGEVTSTVADQEAHCRSHALKRGYQVVDAFLETSEDPEESRPELRRLRAAVWRREVDVIVASAPERLFFDVNRLIRFAREAYALDVHLEFVDGTPSDQLLNDW